MASSATQGRGRRLRPSLRHGPCAALLSVSTLGVLLAPSAAMPAYAEESDAYLQDYSAADGMIIPRNGYAPTADSPFSWSAQAVIDMDLADYSVNGFLESVWPIPSAEPALGSGYASLQHFHFAGQGAGDILHWRIPVAIDRGMCGAQMTFVFDDADWDADVGSLQQYSEFPGYESAFNRFTGIAGYVPHTGAPAASTWATDGAGHTTLVIDLSDLQAGTSTVFQFTGTARATPGFTGAENIANGTSYGAKLTVQGVNPAATCHSLNYPTAEVDAGSVVTAVPVLTDDAGMAVGAPVGSSYALGEDAPAGAQVDPDTGVITWTVPDNAPSGVERFPVELTFPDDAAFTAGSMLTADMTVQVSAGPVEPYAPEPGSPPSETNVGASVEPEPTESAEPDSVVPTPTPPPETADTPSQPSPSIFAPPHFEAHDDTPTITITVTGGSWRPVLYIIFGGTLLTGVGTTLLHPRGWARFASSRRPLTPAEE